MPFGILQRKFDRTSYTILGTIFFKRLPIALYIDSHVALKVAAKCIRVLKILESIPVTVINYVRI